MIKVIFVDEHLGTLIANEEIITINGAHCWKD
jgi:hypothetical protein